LAAINEYPVELKEIETRKENSLRDLGKTVQALFPDDKISLHAVLDGVVVSGVISDPQQINVLINIAESFFPEVHNNLTVGNRHEDTRPTTNAKPKDLQTVLHELFPDKDIKIYPLNNSVVLIGTADPKTIALVHRIAEDYYPSVIDHMTVVGKLPQLMGDIPRVASEEVAQGGLQNQMREIRQDVKLLRDSVKQLIELLQVDDEWPDKLDALDSRSYNNPARKPGAVIWEAIGIRAEPTEVTGSRYRGGLKILEMRKESPAAAEEMRQGDVLV
jgi:Flp pilus assembly secretin CpaC